MSIVSPIPRIIHQTWKDRTIPPAWEAYHRSWRRHHPAWELRLWTDHDLRELIRRDYAWFLPIYDGYPHPIQRVDAARYFMLHRYGGLYVDLDFECLRPLDDLLAAHEVVLGVEPAAHGALHKARTRGLERIVCNALCASTPAHPFWEHVFRRLVAAHWEPDPLDATGPFFMTRALATYDAPARVFLPPAELLYPITSDEAQAGLLDDPTARARVTAEAFAIHHWSGSWWRPAAADAPPSPPSLATRVRRILGAARRTLRPMLAEVVANAAQRRPLRAIYPRVPTASTARPPSDATPPVLILTPVKDAGRHLARHFDNLARLTYPRERLALAFLEGDSSDDTYQVLADNLPALRASFARVELFKRDHHYRIPAGVPRWAPEIQLQRRSILAKSRNALLSQALRDEAWVLWMDVDLASYPADIIERLLAVGKPIVVPNCVVAPGGKTFDLNTFQIAHGTEAGAELRDGLYQPPTGDGRRYLCDLRQHDLVPVDAVGGTMLLIEAELHREGLVFPAAPYRHYIETEGLAMLARDLGITCWGLPNLEIVHPAT